LSHKTSSPDIVAGPGEKSFAERYNLKLTLPIPETNLLAILERLHLSYELYGGRGTARAIPPVLHSRGIDTSRFERCYQIYGGVDNVRHIGEAYLAYVDHNGEVLYIENHFSYTAI
jgi:hypothetical protein